MGRPMLVRARFTSLLVGRRAGRPIDELSTRQGANRSLPLLALRQLVPPARAQSPTRLQSHDERSSTSTFDSSIVTVRGLLRREGCPHVKT